MWHYVQGSSMPHTLDIKCRGVAQMASALRSGRRGRRFKSGHPDHKQKYNMLETSFRYATPHLIIRFYQENDFLLWQTMFNRMRDKQNQWDWTKEPTKDLTIKRFKKKLNIHLEERTADKLYYFCIEHHNNLIGISILNHINRRAQKAELGFQLNNLYWGNGFGTEIAIGTLEIAEEKLKLETVYAEVNPKNTASIKIMEQLNFNNYGLDNSNRLHFIKKLTSTSA